MRRINVGIIGCGEVVQIIHLPSLYQLADRFQVTALCDVSAHVVETIGAQWQVAKRYQDYHDLVRQPDVDAVLIASPHVFHAETVLAAVEAGKHVLVEKPMCLTMGEVDAIVAARQKAGVCVQVGTMRRHAPAFLEACRLVAEMPAVRMARVHDVIGTNALIINRTSRVVRGHDISEGLRAEASALQAARVEEALGGPVEPAHAQAYMLLLGLSTHDTSAMREMLGLPKSVLYARWHPEGDARYLTAAFDYGSFVCHFETGVDRIPRYDTYLQVWGPGKIVRVEYDTPYVRNLPIRLLVTEADADGKVSQSSVHPGWGDAFVEEWLAFYHSVTEQTPPKTSPEDYRLDMRLFQEIVRHLRATA